MFVCACFSNLDHWIHFKSVSSEKRLVYIPSIFSRLLFIILLIDLINLFRIIVYFLLTISKFRGLDIVCEAREVEDRKGMGH